MFTVENMAANLEPTPGVGARNPGQHKPLPLKRQPESEEGLDK
jgi:hypothetical protein